jgi:hypothetical protein
VLRVNLGGRFAAETGLLFDLALHYVSAYEMPLIDPHDPIGREPFPLGNDVLMVAALGYRVALGSGRTFEGGLHLRAPLGTPFREYAGVPMPPQLQDDSPSDFGGTLLVRLVSFYLRGSI